jgi:GAF domain-containing protein
MKAPEFPVDEFARLKVLRSLALLDTGPEEAFSHIVDLAKELFNSEICLISLIDTERQWFKAQIGLDILETPRDISFCGHAILRNETFVVLDALKDERFFDNPLVSGPPFIRFYAGAPIRLPHGYNIGTVCLISSNPREIFSDHEQVLLSKLSDLCVQVIAARKLSAELDRAQLNLNRMQMLPSIEGLDFALTTHDGEIEIASELIERLIEQMSHVEPGFVPQNWIDARHVESDGANWTISLTADGLRLRVAIDAGGYLIQVLKASDQSF